MGFPSKLLNDEEEIVIDLRPHWWYLAAPTAALLGAVVLGLIVLVKAGDGTGWDVLKYASGLLVLAVLVWFGLVYLSWANINFVVTTDRVIFRRGVIAKQGVEIPLEKINTVFYNQGVFERLIGAGDLRIESAGEKGTETFSDVRRPHLVQNEIYRQMESNENRKFDRIGRGAPASTTLSIPEQIDKLDELRQRGVISEEEFSRKKTELLGRM